MSDDKKKHSKTGNQKIQTLENRVAPLALGGVMSALESGTAGAANGASGTNISNSRLTGGDDNSNSGIIFSPTINVAGASADNQFHGGDQTSVGLQGQDARTSSGSFAGGGSSSATGGSSGAIAGGGAGGSSNANNDQSAHDRHDSHQSSDNHTNNSEDDHSHDGGGW